MKSYIKKKPEADLDKPGIHAIFVSCLAMFLIACHNGANKVESQPQSLAAAVTRMASNHRPVLPRLSGAEGYQDFDKMAGVRKLMQSDALLDLEAQVTRELKLESNPDIFHADALIKVLTHGKSDALRNAVEDLELALVYSPQNAQAANDLAACLYALSLEEESMQYLPRALEIIKQVLILEPDMVEAHFNHALILQELRLPAHAEEAWNHYLEKEQDPNWKNEALDHLEELSKPPQWSEQYELIKSAVENGAPLHDLCKGFRGEIRQEIESRLLFNLEENEKLAHALSNWLKDRDPFLIETLESAGLDALIYLNEGHKAYADKDRDKAAALYDQAADQFGDNPYRFRARYLQIIALYENHPKQALRLIQELITDLDPTPFAIIKGESYWVQGLIQDNLGKKALARQSYSDAIPFFEKVSDNDRLTGIYMMLSQCLFDLGQNDAAWRYEKLAWDRVEKVNTNHRLSQIVLLAANSSMLAGNLDLALFYANELVKLTTSGNFNSSTANAYHWRARILADMGKGDLALADLALAKNVAVGDEDIRELLDANRLTVEAEIAVEPSEAASIAAKALSMLKGLNHHANRSAIQASMARSLLNANDENALTALIDAVDLYESNRQALDQDSRSRFFGKYEELYSLITALQIRENNHVEAFNWSERMRARSLYDHVSGNENPLPKSLGEIQNLIPSGTVLVSFLNLDNQWLVFLAGSQYFKKISLDDCDPQQLPGLVTRFKSGFKDQFLEDVEASRTLFNQLIKPLEAHLSQFNAIVFIEDGVLKGLPWAAMLNGDQYLVEQYSLATAPSANIYIQGSLRNPVEYNYSLAIGAPDYDKSKWPDLPKLEGARAEANAIEQAYADSGLNTQIALDADANQKWLEMALRQSQLVQFSGHALSSKDKYAKGGLLMDSTNSEDVLLEGRIIEGFSIKSELVILSACNTGVGYTLGREGQASIARPFLIGGAPCVVAGLWAVNDQATQDLMIQFHQYLLEGLPPDAALSHAQRNLIDRGSPADHWAAFTVVGFGRPIAQ